MSQITAWELLNLAQSEQWDLIKSLQKKVEFHALEDIEYHALPIIDLALKAGQEHIASWFTSTNPPAWKLSALVEKGDWEVAEWLGKQGLLGTLKGIGLFGIVIVDCALKENKNELLSSFIPIGLEVSGQILLQLAKLEKWETIHWLKEQGSLTRLQDQDLEHHALDIIAHALKAQEQEIVSFFLPKLSVRSFNIQALEVLIQGGQWEFIKWIVQEYRLSFQEHQEWFTYAPLSAAARAIKWLKDTHQILIPTVTDEYLFLSEATFLAYPALHPVADHAMLAHISLDELTTATLMRAITVSSSVNRYQAVLNLLDQQGEILPEFLRSLVNNVHDYTEPRANKESQITMIPHFEAMMRWAMPRMLPKLVYHFRADLRDELIDQLHGTHYGSPLLSQMEQWVTDLFAEDSSWDLRWEASLSLRTAFLWNASRGAWKGLPKSYEAFVKKATPLLLKDLSSYDLLNHMLDALGVDPEQIDRSLFPHWLFSFTTQEELALKLKDAILWKINDAFTAETLVLNDFPVAMVAEGTTLYRGMLCANPEQIAQKFFSEGITSWERKTENAWLAFDMKQPWNDNNFEWIVSGVYTTFNLEKALTYAHGMTSSSPYNKIPLLIELRTEGHIPGIPGLSSEEYEVIFHQIPVEMIVALYVLDTDSVITQIYTNPLYTIAVPTWHVRDVLDSSNSQHTATLEEGIAAYNAFFATQGNTSHNVADKYQDASDFEARYTEAELEQNRAAYYEAYEVYCTQQFCPMPHFGQFCLAPTLCD